MREEWEDREQRSSREEEKKEMKRLGERRAETKAREKGKVWGMKTARISKAIKFMSFENIICM